MRTNHLAGLKVMVAGLAAVASREVTRVLVTATADVACVGDEAETAQLQRDLGLYGLTIKALPIDLGSVAEVRLFAEHQQVRNNLPHIIVCCCDGGEHCPSSVLSAHLSPPLFLHLITRRCGPVIERFLDLGTLDLRFIIQRRLIFSHGAAIRRAMIGRNAFALQRRHPCRSAARRSGSSPGRPTRQRRAHQTPSR